MDLTNIDCELDTPDLRLRRVRLSDAEGLYKMLSDPESMKYWSHTPVTEVSDALKVLREDLESDAKGDSICWAVTLPASRPASLSAMRTVPRVSRRSSEVLFSSCSQAKVKAVASAI